MSTTKKLLKFPCDCISSTPTCEEPWARVAKDGMFKDGTKETLLNELNQNPQTIAQLAKATNLAQPTVFRHITELVRNKLIRKDELPNKNYVVENYYKLNFPVVTQSDETHYRDNLEGLAKEMVALFEKRLPGLKKKYQLTDAAKTGWKFEEFAQYLFHTVQRKARRKLEKTNKLSAKLKRAELDFILWGSES